MEIVIISDTHTKHDDLSVPEGDILIHCGDISYRGTPSECNDFLHWFKHQPHKYKILIAGNHDFAFERGLITIPDDIIYLQDSLVNIEGINIYGSPHQPFFHNWAFNKYSPELKEIWSYIPSCTDILVTHGPPLGILDEVVWSKEQVGCHHLREKVRTLPNLKVHCFGHIHEGYGMVEEDGIKFVNASVLNEKYQLVNKPWVLNVEPILT